MTSIQLPDDIRSEFSINSKGQVKTSIRGGARLVAVSDMALIKHFQSANQTPSKLAQTLTEKGFECANFSEDGIPDTAFVFICEYYAFEASHRCTEEAKNLYRAFAAIGFRTWVQKELGWEPNQVSQPQPKTEFEMIAVLATGMSQLGTGLAQLANQTSIIKTELTDLRDEHLDLCEGVEDLRGTTKKLEKKLARRFDDILDLSCRIDKVQEHIDINHELPDFARRIEQMEATVRDASYARIEAEQLLRGFAADANKPVPELTTRVKVRRLAVAFAQAYSIDYAVVFNRLYMEFRDRYHYDVKARCRNKGRYLERLEKDGKIEDFYVMAVKILCLPSLYSPWGNQVASTTKRIEDELM